MPKKKQTSVELPSGASVSIGGLVCYYLDGWRYGYLSEIVGSKIRIQPIAAKNGVTPRLVSVSDTDLKVA